MLWEWMEHMHAVKELEFMCVLTLTNTFQAIAVIFASSGLVSKE